VFGAYPQSQEQSQTRVPKEAETATIHSFNKRKAAKIPTFIIDEGSMVDVELLVRRDSPSRL
jgi:hypothetical protein